MPKKVKEATTKEQTRLIPVTHNNHYLFSDYYLNELVIDTDEWQKGDGIENAFKEIKELYDKVKSTIEKANEPQTEERFIKPVLEILGHHVEVQTKAPQIDHAKRPDYAFFADEKTKEKAFAEIGSKEYFNYVMAVGDAKSWNRPLDKKIKTHRGDPFNDANPNFQMDYYLRITNKQWGILTNGPKWRLYNRDVSYLLDHYYEVDLVALLEQGKIDEFKYFYLFFRRVALIKDAFLDTAYKQSKDYAVGVEENLKDRVYEALLRLAKGFWEYDGNKFTENDLKAIHDNCLIVLYQLLFVLNAECRGLLPLQNNTYASTYSLRGISKEIIDKLESKTELLPNTNHYWSKLFSLFKLIYHGNEHLGITFFDGSLFDFKEHDFLNKYSIGDKHLIEAIDRLCRAKTKKGLAPIDYRDLEIRHLGGIYEGILEYKLQLAGEDIVVYKEKGKEKYLALSEAKKTGTKYKPDDVIKKGEIYLTTDKGERKATGSYFTPKYIVNYIVENTLGPLVEGKKPKEILELNVLDPAMGSGHFLLGATDFLARAIHEKEAQGELLSDEEVEDEVNDIRRHVVERCVNGVDINPLAVELAKLTLWLHTMSKGKPLNFLDHNLKCGNSLIGSKLSDLGHLPMPKKKKEKETSMKLPGMDAFFSGYKHDLGPILDWIIKIEYKTTDSPEDIKAKKYAFEYVEKMTDKYRQVADLWISKYFGNEFDKGIYQDAVDYVLKGKSQLPERKIKEYFHKAQELKKEKNFFHWELEFPEVFFDKYGRYKDNPGFDAVIGNPPWVESKYLESVFKNYYAVNYSSMLGQFDIFNGFVEIGRRILSKLGMFGMIMPNRFCMNPNYFKLREYLFKNYGYLSIKDYGDGVFPDVNMPSCVLIGKPLDSRSAIQVTNLEGISFEYSLSEVAKRTALIIRIDTSPMFEQLIKKCQSLSLPLESFYDNARGVEIGKESPLIKTSHQTNTVRFGIGEDLSRYSFEPQYYLKLYDQQTDYKDSSIYEGSKIIVRKTGHGINASIDTSGVYIIQVIYIFKKKHNEINDLYTLSLLNSRLIYQIYYALFGEREKKTFPHIRQEQFLQLPIRRINFTTPKEERERLVDELKGMYWEEIE